MKEVFPRVFRINGRLFTLSPDRLSHYGEKIIEIEGRLFRSWNPYRSKLSAAISKGLKEFSFSKDSVVLYLGASTGTTVSHLSDICVDGELFSVEISPFVFPKLLSLSEKRENVIPILSDASNPESYSEIGPVDVIYQDIAQPNQAEILTKNSKFLKKGSIAYLCVKSQSIDVLRSPKEVYENVASSLSRFFNVLDRIDLSPFDKHHQFFVLEKK